MSELLKHPVLVALVGAALTGIIGPAIVRHWQVHQKELEIKIDLVSAISESIMSFVVAIQVAHIGAKRYGENPDQADLTKAYRNWQVQSGVIGTKLQAYLPASTIPDEWSRLCSVLEDFYALEGMSKEAVQTFAIGISEKLSRLLDEGNVAKDWEQIQRGILRKKSSIITRILASRGFNLRQSGAWFRPNLRLRRSDAPH